MIIPLLSEIIEHLSRNSMETMSKVYAFWIPKQYVLATVQTVKKSRN
jgi:hypothetical protein